MDSSIELSNKYHFSIIPDYVNANEIKMLIRLVTVFARISNAIYHKPIGTFKYFYSKTGKYAYYFLTEYHDEKSQKTRLMTSLYINHDLYSFILRFENNLEVYHGINIEDTYILPNLFNHLLPNQNELIIIYIMKGSSGKNMLLLNQYDYSKDLKFKTKLDKYSSSNYIREDICDNPKYMQSAFINSFISYDYNDKQKIGTNSDNKYFVYQRDIATVISCDDENGNPFYQYKKIQMPQCLNVLNEINGKSNVLIFQDDEEKIVIDFENPNYKSFRNVEIEFLDSALYNKYLIVQGVKNGERTLTVNKTTTLSNLERFEFTRTFNMRKGKIYQIPYRIKKTGISGISTSCHLSSDICYFEFKYQVSGEILPTDILSYCPYCDEYDNNICFKCKDIIGIKKKEEGCGCECDEEKGFNPEPKQFGNEVMCECKEGYVFYENIEQCKNPIPPPPINPVSPTDSLIDPEYCIIGYDENSKTDIITERKPGMSITKKDGKSYCPEEETISLLPKTGWFKLGDTTYFHSIKIEKCVFILYSLNNKIVMYSNREDCEYDYNFSDEYNENLGISTEREFNYSLNKAYEYKPYGDNNSLIIEEGNITFYLLNNYTENLYSTLKISDECKNKINDAYKIPSLLTFMANTKREGYSVVQVDYQFYNPIQEYIAEKISLADICKKDKGSNLRTLSTPEESTNNDNNNNIPKNEVIIHAKIYLDPEIKEKADELKSKDIDIFNSSSEFYTDVCFPYTTPEKSDLYLEDRKDYYYPDIALCEEGCTYLGYDEVYKRIKCQCGIKNGTDDYGNISFTYNEKVKSFNRTFLIPNIRVMFCRVKYNNIGQLFGLFLFLAFFLLFIIFFSKKSKKNADEIPCPKDLNIKPKKDGDNGDDNKNNKGDDNSGDDGNNNDENNDDEDNKKKNKGKNNKKVYDFEIPIEELEKGTEYKYKKKNKKGIKDEDEDEDKDEEEYDINNPKLNLNIINSNINISNSYISPEKKRFNYNYANSNKKYNKILHFNDNNYKKKKNDFAYKFVTIIDNEKSNNIKKIQRNKNTSSPNIFKKTFKDYKKKDKLAYSEAPQKGRSKPNIYTTSKGKLKNIINSQIKNNIINNYIKPRNNINFNYEKLNELCHKMNFDIFNTKSELNI